ncbi:hypothetical protein PPRY_b0949 [Pseudoalteromonas prydzensis ACAM 620]|nr:hypothetical protein [Pseudoalteromonas prydzensis ACAM 620]
MHVNCIFAQNVGIFAKLELLLNCGIALLSLRFNKNKL